MAEFTRKFEVLESKQETLQTDAALMHKDIKEHSYALEHQKTPEFYQNFEFIRESQKKSRLALELSQETEEEQKKLKQEFRHHKAEN